MLGTADGKKVLSSREILRKIQVRQNIFLLDLPI